PDDAFRSIDAATALHAPVEIRFSEAMDARSVAASLTVRPATVVTLAWDSSGRILTVRPASHWTAGMYHTITIAPGTLAAGGRPMSSAVRAAFVTRPTTSGRISATARAGDAASIATGFRITFDRPVAPDAVAAALTISPAVIGSLVADSGRPDVAVSASLGFTFTPSTALLPGTIYEVALGPLDDVDGASVGTLEAATFQTSTAPRIVRFRPANGATKIDRAAPLSVRFSDSMEHRTTNAAVSVTADGKPVAGSVRFAESSTVVVFRPTAPMPAGAKVVMTVGATAASARGVPLGVAASVTVTTMAAPAPVAKVAPRTVKSTPATSGSGSGGAAVGGGSWGAVETYYLRLMNCTRTGGTVTSTGTCSSPGGRNVAPLKLDSGISSKVSRPYAKRIAVNNQCSHFIGGNPGDRLRAAGYTSYIWAENLGCRSGNPYSAVLGSHLFFQSEKSYSGGHYVNLMNAKYDRAGIGVWVSGGRVRLVIDFYHPR
ncbi:MAG: Ig-like domain-containing protein, partial [Candidatus Limnocylindrales bacterium]